MITSPITNTVAGGDNNDVLLFHRDAQQRLLAVPAFTAAAWSRRAAGGGTFRVTLPLDAGRAVQPGHILDIQLDGRTEFTGIVQRRTISQQPDRPPAWTLDGADLTWWWQQRVIVPPAAASHDVQDGVPAETAIRHYLTDHLLNPTDTSRTISVPAALAPANSPPLGPTVTVRARFGLLGREVERLAALANLVVGAERDDADGRIRFFIRAPRVRTAGTAQPVIFSLALGAAQAVTYTDAPLTARNTVYVLGSGSGATRLLEVVRDDAEIALHSRREMALDARDADATAPARDAGAAELAAQQAAALRVLVDASPFSPLRYRDHWDVGDVVTVDLPDLHLRVDRRIDQVDGSLSAGEPLQLRCLLGAPPADAAALLRRLDARTLPGRLA